MGLIGIVIAAAAILGVAYVTYGSLLARLLRLDATRPTPAVELRDDLDYEPIRGLDVVSATLFGDCRRWTDRRADSRRADLRLAAGADLDLVGSIFIGGVHDFTSLVASIRHQARSIAEVVRDHMSRLSYLLFLAFIWIALVYIIVAFTDITAASFVGPATEENGGVGGGAIASSSLLYLILPIIMGLLLRYGKLPLGPLTAVFIVLVGVAIRCGKFIPFDVANGFGRCNEHWKPRSASVCSASRQAGRGAQHGRCRCRGRTKAARDQSSEIWDVAARLLPGGGRGAGVAAAATARALGRLLSVLRPRSGRCGRIFDLDGGIEIKYPAFRGWSKMTRSGVVRSDPLSRCCSSPLPAAHAPASTR